MDINELESFNLADAVKFHDELNPRLFKNDRLRTDVKKQLMLIAQDFVSYMGISDLDIEDITISGSNAAYSYTPHSDIDLHILVDFSKLSDDEVYKELFGAKKTLYNDKHDITVNKIPVELYVQDTNQEHTSLGEYSLLNDKWVKIPKKRKANFDQVATKAKYEKLGELVELALRSKDLEKVTGVLDLIKRYRRAGLSKGGEFGPENLAFKAVRTQGLIQKLFDLKATLHSKSISTESLAERSQIELEDYDPNGPPPGPEFKPTMPVGTVRVDVSDVYDWYKLGQHISNLKGLGKHDFGKGPPSTIMSFGDEDLEHQYIQALKKTGLDVADIDPPGGPKVKGMKTDPTYNVNEELGSEKVIDTARRMYDRYKDLTYTARERAHGHAMNHESNTPEYRYWIAVADQIQRLEDSNLDVKEDQTLQFAAEKTAAVNPYGGWRDTQFRGAIGEATDTVSEGASGYIPSKKQTNDPRYKTALTVDIKPDTMQKNAKKLGWKLSRAGIPPLLRK